MPDEPGSVAAIRLRGPGAHRRSPCALRQACATAKKIPFPGPAVLISGVGIIAGGIAIIVGIWADVAALGLAVFLFFTTFFIHNFWTLRGYPMARQIDMTQFTKPWV